MCRLKTNARDSSSNTTALLQLHCFEPILSHLSPMIVDPRTSRFQTRAFLVHGGPSACVPPTHNGEQLVGYVNVSLEPAPEQVRIHKKHRPSLKCVRFSSFVTYHEAAPVNDPTMAWYQRQDFERIKHDSRLCILAYHKMGRKASRLPEEFCIRGLENNLSKSTNRLQRYTRRETINAVLLAQKGCDFGGCHSHLALFAELRSRDKVKAAISFAAKDSRIWLEEYRGLQH
jgi:hypothetical protein